MRVNLEIFLAEGPPASASLQPPIQTMAQATQPMQQSYRMQLLGSFDDEPAIVTCSQCGMTGQTYTYKVACCSDTTLLMIVPNTTIACA